MSDQSLSWIYDPSAGAPKNEDYLLGKSVDANFERGTLGQINAVEYDCTPESIFSSKVGHQVDLQRKLTEDPLVLLKKTELETRKRILDNPIRLKQIQKCIKNIKKEKKKKTSKKKKKKSKRSRRHSSSSSSESDLDKALLAKLRETMKHDSDQTSNAPVPERPSPRPSRSPSPGGKSRSVRHRSGSRSRDRRSHLRKRSSRSRSRDRRKEPSGRQLHSPGDKRRESSRGNRQPDEDGRAVQRKMDDAERLRKIEEMIANARWREEQRAQNVQHHREQEAKETTALQQRRHDPEFVSKQLARVADVGTVEKRIQANRANIQRNSASMNEPFARR